MIGRIANTLTSLLHLRSLLGKSSVSRVFHLTTHARGDRFGRWDHESELLP